MPKRELLRPLVAAVEIGRLVIAKGLPHADTLVRELKAFKVTITDDGRDTYGGEGQHDDLVLAVALAVWRATRSTSGSSRIPAE